MQLIILGDGSVGKTSLLNRYADKEFNLDHIKTIGMDFVKTNFKSEDANGMIITFDLTNQISFDNVKNWLDSIYQHADPTIAKILIGNKLDLKDQRIASE